MPACPESSSSGFEVDLGVQWRLALGCSTRCGFLADPGPKKAFTSGPGAAVCSSRQRCELQDSQNVGVSERWKGGESCHVVSGVGVRCSQCIGGVVGYRGELEGEERLSRGQAVWSRWKSACLGQLETRAVFSYI